MQHDPSSSGATVPADLLAAAEQAAHSAHAPYSRFHVGAALRIADGRVQVGCNVENAVFGLGICAERNAMAAAVLACGPQRPAVIEIVVAALDHDGGAQPAPPCGACRQVLFEFAPDARVWFRDAARQWRWRTVRELLPDAFTL